METKIVVALLLLTIVVCVYSECPHPMFTNKHVVKSAAHSAAEARKISKNSNTLREPNERTDRNDVFFVENPTYKYDIINKECEMTKGAVLYTCTKQGGSWTEAGCIKNRKLKYPIHHHTSGHYEHN